MRGAIGASGGVGRGIVGGAQVFVPCGAVDLTTLCQLLCVWNGGRGAVVEMFESLEMERRVGVCARGLPRKWWAAVLQQF